MENRACEFKFLDWVKPNLKIWRDKRDPKVIFEIVQEHACLVLEKLLPLTRLNTSHGDIHVVVEGSSLQWTVGANHKKFNNDETSDSLNSNAKVKDSSSDSIVTEAAKLIKKNKRKTATKILHSHGTAVRNTRTLKMMLDNHPDYNEARIAPKKSLQKNFKFTINEVKKVVKRKTGDIESSLDVYGWSSPLLLGLKNKMVTDAEDYFEVYSDFIAALGEVEHIPTAAAFVVTCGALTPLNKISAEENADLLAQNKDPKLRPVNNGTTTMKHLGTSALRSNSGKKASKRLYNQYSGRSHGMETVGHSSQAAYHSGKIIHKEDQGSAFNRISRNAVLEGARNHWPSGAPLFEKYYNLKSPIFYFYTDDMGRRGLCMLFSKEGTRQGDPFGTIGYCVAAEMFLYAPLRKEFPQVVTLSATDDMNNFWEPPEENTQVAWDMRYDQIEA